MTPSQPRTFVVSFFLTTLFATSCLSEQMDDIFICVDAVERTTGRTVDARDAEYVSKFFGSDEIHWPGVVCTTSWGEAWDLTVDEELLIRDGWSSETAREGYNAISKRIDEAIEDLEERISELGHVRTDVKVGLQREEVTVEWAEQKVDQLIAEE